MIRKENFSHIIHNEVIEIEHLVPGVLKDFLTNISCFSKRHCQTRHESQDSGSHIYFKLTRFLFLDHDSTVTFLINFRKF